MSLSINNFVNFTVEQPGSGVPAYNVNSLAIITAESPSSSGPSYSSFGHGAVASVTGSLSGGAIPLGLSAITISSGGSGYTNIPTVFFVGGTPTTGNTITPASGTAVVNSSGVVTGINVINGGANYATVPTIIIGSTYRVYTDPIQVGLDFGTGSETYAMAQEVFSQSPNILSGGGQLVIYPMTSADTLSTAIFAITQLIYTGGICWCAYNPSVSEIVAASNEVQSLTPKTLLFAPTNNKSDLYSSGSPQGMCYQVFAAGNQQTRTLLYTVSAQAARLFAAAYASRLLSTNFNGSNTTITMNFKQLTGIQPGSSLVADSGIDSTTYAQCQVVGTDFYTSIQGIPETISTGANGYADNVFNMTWLLNTLQTTTFNFLAQTPTKIPQTESGMTALKGAMTNVLNQAVANGFLAPGQWTATTFGNPVDLIRNIADFGYYIYSQPVSQQLQAQRQNRVAPLVQIGVKFAGAIQSVNGIIFINP